MLFKGTWIEGMVKIIKTQFADVGKGWFNMKENERITYDFGKLKKFLTVIRLMMQVKPFIMAFIFILFLLICYSHP